MLCSGKTFLSVFLRTFSFSWEMDKNVLLLLVWTWKKLLYFQVFDPPLPAIISGWSWSVGSTSFLSGFSLRAFVFRRIQFIFFGS